MLEKEGFAKVKKTIALPSILLLVSLAGFNVAQARGMDSYIGIQGGTADASFDGVSGDVDLDFMMLQLGIWLTDEVSAELRMGKGFGDDSIGSVDVELESIGGLYATYHWHMGDQFSVYGIAGWSQASGKFSGPGGSDQADDNGPSLGAGLKISIVSVEFMRYLDTSDVEIDAVSVGLQYTFD